MKKRYVQITIDGPSASGKSTVARLLAKRLRFFHIDTGAIYRAFALWCHENAIDYSDAKALEKQLKDLSFEVRGDLIGQRKYYLDQKDVTNEIRREDISDLASKIAVIPEVRKCSSNIQRALAEDKNVVIEGRDAGSVVFPKAAFKFYITASVKERASRRRKELLEKGYKDVGGEEEMMEELERRDERDTNRKDSPLIRPIDAESIDTTGLTIDQVVQKISKKVRRLHKKKHFSWLWRPFVGPSIAESTFVYKLVYLITKCIYKVLYRARVRGLENYPTGAAIIAPNHVSFLDPPAVGSACPKEVYAMGQDYLFRIPIVGWIIHRLNTLPVTNTASDKGVIKKVISLLMQDKQVIIFPEGSRSFDGEILPLKKGVGMIVSKTGCQVVPTYLDGIHEIWPRGRKFPRFWGKITITFGKPLFWGDYESTYPSKKEASEALLHDLEERLKQMKRDLAGKR